MANCIPEKNIRIIGITGPTGAGKGAVSDIFKNKYSVPVLDADKIYHEILAENNDCKSELVSAFGSEICVNGNIDRKVLASVVFANGAKEKLARLNEITHRYVKSEFKARTKVLANKGAKCVIYDVPLLIESGMNNDCNCVISVLANKETRLRRIIMRDNISEDSALMRIKSQKSDEFYISSSNYVIHNDNTQDELSKEVGVIANSLGLSESCECGREFENQKEDRP